MGRSALTELTLACPECGTDNRMVVDKIPSTELVRCSHCRAELGTWGDLERQAEAHGLTHARTVETSA